jgi:dihydroflavonol-4-reductase
MTDINNTVAVTGATGFVAAHLVKQLLEKGYTVHGTVRSLKDKRKYEYLYQLPNAETNLKLFEADLLKDGSFDESIQGTSVVYHTASPFFLGESKDPQKELVDPAVQGTLTVLQSAAKISSVRRVVITSSVVALYDPSEIAEANRVGKQFDESSWNNASSLTQNPYYYSKAEAEKAAWKFYEENKNSVSFDIVTINPSLIIGPILQDFENNSQVNTSSDIVVSVIKSLRENRPLDVYGLGMVDVRDVATVHILAGEAPEASNQRYVTSNGTYSLVELGRLLVSGVLDELGNYSPIVNGDEEEGKRNASPQFTSSKLRNTFPSFKFIDFKQTLIDNYFDLKSHKLI